MNTSVNSSNSSVGSGDSVGCEVQGVMPNLVGLAESYRCAVRTDNWGEKDLHAGISIPSITSHQLPVSLNARMFQDDRSNVNSSRTKCISFSLGVMSKNLRHKLTTDFSVRDEAVTTGVSTVPVVGQVKDASKEVMSLVAPSSKSSIMYSYTNDTRNNGPSPTRGNLVETVVEVRKIFSLQHSVLHDFTRFRCRLRFLLELPSSLDLVCHYRCTAKFCLRCGYCTARKKGRRLYSLMLLGLVFRCVPLLPRLFP